MFYSFAQQDWFDTEKYLLQGFELIDLSVPIEQHAEVPGEAGYSDPDVLFLTKLWVDLNVKPYCISKIVMGAHTGTHIDAPMHAKENGNSVDKIPNEYVGPALIIEANKNLDQDSLFEKLSSAKSTSIVVMRGDSDYKIHADFRNQIIRANPRLVVFGDCVNVEGVEDTIQYLGNDIPMVMGADQSAINRLKDGDLIFALPLKFHGVEAAPVRLFALKLELIEKQKMEVFDFSMGD